MNSAAQPIRVVPADDQTLVRSSFAGLIASAPDTARRRGRSAGGGEVATEVKDTVQHRIDEMLQERGPLFS
ncbi:MAG: hypothetical protein WCD21_42430 [Streptomyces sp.]